MHVIYYRLTIINSENIIKRNNLLLVKTNKFNVMTILEIGDINNPENVILVQ